MTISPSPSRPGWSSPVPAPSYDAARQAITPPQVLRVQDLEIDLGAHTVQRKGVAVELTPTEFNLLATIASQPGRAFTRLQLLEISQGMAYEGYERSIDAHIKNLRAKLEPDPKSPHYIETVFGVGYRFPRQ